MKTIYTLTVVIAAAIFMPACATITKGTTEVVDVRLSDCPKNMECTATNKKGVWEFTAPGTVQVRKSDDALRIECREDGQHASRSLMPTSDSSIWGNVVVGGIVGAGVDANSDAHWELQDSVTLRCEEE